ncbi:MAG: putative Ig domain-containing protein, partial [Chthoniobacterales bacterium]
VAENIFVTGNGAGGASVTVTNQIITISGLSALYPDPVDVAIGGLTTPDTAGSLTNSGRYTFSVQSQGLGGSLAPIASSPVAVVTIPIANARNADPVTFVPTLLGQTVAVEGVANVGKLGSGQINSALQDSANGIATYSTNVANLPMRGNRYVVSGGITQFNGLTRINITNGGAIYDFGATNDPAPVTVTVPQLNASTGATNGVTLQSRVVRLENLYYVSGTWATTNSVTLRDAASNNVTVYIPLNSTAISPPSYPVTLTGIAGQFDSTSPFDTGFQIQPRDQADAPVLPPVITSALTATATNGVAFVYQITTDNNPPATAFAAAPLPAGLTVNGSTGLISGTPTASGTFNVTISATNAGGTDTETLVLTVTQTGQTFSAWSGGLSNTPSLQLKYAIGGATNASATNGIPMSNSVTSSNLSITAVVRTNDPNLSVFGQSIVNLGVGIWTNNDVSRITNGVDQTGVPSGNQRQIFSTPLGIDGKKFLRLQTTLSNQ